MKKILFCNIPMTIKVSKCIYKSDDYSVPVADRPVSYPVAAFLEKTLSAEDDVKAVLLVKKDELGQYKKNISGCIEELMTAAEVAGAKFEYTIIGTDFKESQVIHDSLLLSIVDHVDGHELCEARGVAGDVGAFGVVGLAPRDIRKYIAGSISSYLLL